MDVEPLELGNSAAETARWLSETIGPRPAGSPEEMAALEAVRARIEELGYDTHLDHFEFIPQAAFLPYYSLASLVFLLGAALLNYFPWPVLLLPLWIAMIPRMNAWLARRVPQKARSANLLVLPPGKTLSDVKLLFCAHIDSARAVPVGPEWLYQARRQTRSAMQRLAWLMAAVVVVEGLGRQYPALRWAVISVAVLVAIALFALDLWDQLGAGQRFTAGANDNASGVGVLMALARKLAGTGDLSCAFLFSGAEEADLCGVRHFAMQEQIHREHLVVVSVDMVGAGEKLRIFDGSSYLTRVKTDLEINARLERADPLAARYQMTRRSGDFAAFAEQGWRASGIEANGTANFWRVYHTELDEMRLVEPEMLDHAAFTLLKFIEQSERASKQH